MEERRDWHWYHWICILLSASQDLNSGGSFYLVWGSKNADKLPLRHNIGVTRITRSRSWFDDNKRQNMTCCRTLNAGTSSRRRPKIGTLDDQENNHIVDKRTTQRRPHRLELIEQRRIVRLSLELLSSLWQFTKQMLDSFSLSL